jgi:hypothetical protein
MTSSPAQRLVVWSADLIIEHRPGKPDSPDDLAAEWLSMVRAPEGLTVIRKASDVHSSDERWTAVYGDTAHALDLPGMLAAVISPLAEAEIPVFVTSTYHADVVLVPKQKRDEALRVLRAAGHEVVGALWASGAVSPSHVLGESSTDVAVDEVTVWEP